MDRPTSAIAAQQVPAGKSRMAAMGRKEHIAQILNRFYDPEEEYMDWISVRLGSIVNCVNHRRNTSFPTTVATLLD